MFRTLITVAYLIRQQWSFTQRWKKREGVGIKADTDPDTVEN